MEASIRTIGLCGEKQEPDESVGINGKGSVEIEKGSKPITCAIE